MWYVYCFCQPYAGFPVVKSSKHYEDAENVDILPAIKSVVKSRGKTEQLKNFNPKSYLKNDDVSYILSKTD